MNPIEKLIPHRGPMLLIDRVDKVSFDGQTSSIEVISCPKETLDPHWGIELIAQAVAAMTALDSKKNESGPIFGYLISVDDFKVSTNRRAQVAETLRTSARLTFVADLMGVYEGSVHFEDSGEEWVRARIKCLLDLEKGREFLRARRAEGVL